MIRAVRLQQKNYMSGGEKEGQRMMAFLKNRQRSAGYARDRMKLLLSSERLDCSPQMINMLRNDLIHIVRKYLVVEEEQITIRISQEPPALLASIPVSGKRNDFS